jgi:hypothetical protein
LLVCSKKLLAVADPLPETAALRNQRFVGFVIANPEPQEPIRSFDRKGAMVQSDAGGPHFLAVALSHSLEL